MSPQPIEVPLIGQQHNMLANLRLSIAVGVMGQLAAADFATCFRQALDKDVTGEGKNIELQFNTGMVARAAVAYTDGLLAALGIQR